MKIKDILENKKNKQEIPASKPRNFVAKNMTTGGAGAHRDKKREQKQGYEKHKSKDLAEARKPAINFDGDDIKELEGIKDLEMLKARALHLIATPSEHPMKPEKVEWFKQAIASKTNNMAVIKLMYDLLLAGSGMSVMGSRNSMASNSYRRQFGEEGIAEEGEGEVAGTITSVTPDGKQVTMKKPDGTEVTTDASAFLPGPNNTVTMNPQAAGDAMKPGTVVNMGQAQTEELDDTFAVSPDSADINSEDDVDLIGSGHNHDVGGDATDSFINQVRDRGFERSARRQDRSATLPRRLGEDDELTKMLTIAGLK